MKSIMFHYSWVLKLTVTVYSSIPFADVIIIYYETAEWKVDFTYFIWYSFDAYHRGILELCFVSLYYDAICVSVFVLGGDLFIFGILINNFMHYDYLKREFRLLKYPKPTKYNLKLKNLLRLHIRINK